MFILTDLQLIWKQFSCRTDGSLFFLNFFGEITTPPPPVDSTLNGHLGRYMTSASQGCSQALHIEPNHVSGPAGADLVRGLQALKQIHYLNHFSPRSHHCTIITDRLGVAQTNTHTHTHTTKGTSSTHCSLFYSRCESDEVIRGWS